MPGVSSDVAATPSGRMRGNSRGGKSGAGQERRFESFLVNNAAGMSHEEGPETSCWIFLKLFLWVAS